MNLERLKELREVIDTAIAIEACGMSDFERLTLEQYSNSVGVVGVIPLVHHLVIGDFAITDLRETRQQIEEKFYSLQP